MVLLCHSLQSYRTIGKQSTISNSFRNVCMYACVQHIYEGERTKRKIDSKRTLSECVLVFICFDCYACVSTGVYNVYSSTVIYLYRLNCTRIKRIHNIMNETQSNTRTGVHFHMNVNDATILFYPIRIGPCMRYAPNCFFSVFIFVR